MSINKFTPKRGAVYDVGGGLAIYWPNVHPCSNEPYDQWVILTMDGDVEVTTRLPRLDMTDAHQFYSFTP